MKELTGYGSLREVSHSGVFCPKCGNYLTVANNGIFHGEVFYCPKEKLVFVIQLKKIEARKEFIEQCEKDAAIKEIRQSINYKNMDAVKKAL